MNRSSSISGPLSTYPNWLCFRNRAKKSLKECSNQCCKLLPEVSFVQQAASDNWGGKGTELGQDCGTERSRKKEWEKFWAHQGPCRKPHEGQIQPDSHLPKGQATPLPGEGFQRTTTTQSGASFPWLQSCGLV